MRSGEGGDGASLVDAAVHCTGDCGPNLRGSWQQLDLAAECGEKANHHQAAVATRELGAAPDFTGSGVEHDATESALGTEELG